MPHLIIQYSPGLRSRDGIETLCGTLSDVMLQSGTFPEGGIRVRGFEAAAAAIGDRHPKNGFADMVLRMGEGRSETEKRAAGDAIMAAARAYFAAELSDAHFALSLEIVEIDKALSWKDNTIHHRLQDRS